MDNARRLNLWLNLDIVGAFGWVALLRLGFLNWPCLDRGAKYTMRFSVLRRDRGPGALLGGLPGSDLPGRRFLFFGGATIRLAVPGVVLTVVVEPMLHISGSRCTALVHEFFK